MQTHKIKFEENQTNQIALQQLLKQMKTVYQHEKYREELTYTTNLYSHVYSQNEIWRFFGSIYARKILI